MPDEEREEEQEEQHEEEHADIEEREEEQEEVEESLATIVAALALTVAELQGRIDALSSQVAALEGITLDHTSNHGSPSAPSEEEQGEEAEIEESKVTPIPSHFMHRLPKLFW